MRTGSFVTPVLAFECDGSLYDVAELERRLGRPSWGETDFHARVFGLSCAGLRPLYEQVRAGRRPTESRLPPGSYLPLAPCDTERATYVQVGPYELDGAEPRFRPGSGRTLLGDGQPVAIPGGAAAPAVEAGVAAILRDDLWRATALEAARAVLGYALVLDWSAGSSAAPWHERPAWLDAPSQLGPVLTTRDELPNLPALEARVTVGRDAWKAGRVGDWRFSVAESIAYVSQHLELRAGDVVGAGQLRLGSPTAVGRGLEYGERVTLSVERLGALSGWAVRGPEPGAWRTGR